MPNYDFQCTACDLAFRKSLPFGSKDVPSCPKCKARSQKVVKPPMTIFKGSGFYKTDSVNKPPVSTTPAMKAEPAKTEAAQSDNAPLSTKTHTHSLSNDHA